MFYTRPHKHLCFKYLSCLNKSYYYYYKINDRRGNPDLPSYVFKTSIEKMEMAKSMDRNGNHFLKDEYYCEFHFKENRNKMARV